MKNVIGTVLAGLGIGVIGTGIGAGAVLLAVLLLLVKPLVAVGIGVLIGKGLAFVGAGSYIAGALGMVLHTTVSVAALPQFFAGLTLLSSYIRPVVNKGETVSVDAKDLKKGIKDLRNSK